MKTAVIAIGGNAILRSGERPTQENQMRNVAATAKSLADLIQKGYDIVITHGNGPQVGFILRRSELSRHELHEVPLDSCGADTQGAIGYMLQKALYNEFRRRGMEKCAATVVTQVLVDRNDPAFRNPTKPIGSFMSEEVARERARTEGWVVREDAGRGWRRVVASPIPRRIIELEAIRSLIERGFTVVAVGGGGIPVIEDENGDLVGVEAVIDKDYASSLLARNIQADLFLISTAVEKVALNYGRPNQRWLERMTLSEARQYEQESHFPAGSMGPKIRAIIEYLEAGGKQAIITNPENLERALRGETGTHIFPD